MRISPFVAPLALALTLPGCPFDDDVGGVGTTVGGEVVIADAQAMLETLALNCNYHALYVTAVEAADDDPENPPSTDELYQVTDSCLQATENTLLDLGMTLNFDGPFETDAVHRAALEGIHYLFFSPMYRPEPAVPGGRSAVYGVETQDYPFPVSVEPAIPVLPSYEVELTPGTYNTHLALAFVSAIHTIEDNTGATGSAAKYVGGTMEIRAQFNYRYFADPQRTAALFAHEAVHASDGYGHKACSVPSSKCGHNHSQPGDACDCDFEFSAYWIEAAIVQASTLGRVISYGPGAPAPIDGGIDVHTKFREDRCTDFMKAVTPFKEGNPDCSTINLPLAAQIEAGSDYWEAFEG